MAMAAITKQGLLAIAILVAVLWACLVVTTTMAVVVS